MMHSKDQQANPITLQQIKNTTPGRPDAERYSGGEEPSEEDHLLAGQEAGRHATIVAGGGIAARGNYKNVGATANSSGAGDGLPRHEEADIDQNSRYTGDALAHLGYSSGHWDMVAAADMDLKEHSKLELQKFPKEMLQAPLANNREQTGATIILTPTSLTTTTTPAVEAGVLPLPPLAANNHNGSGDGGRDKTSPGGGGGGGGCGASLRSVDYKGPKIWRYLVANYPESSQPLAILLIFFALWTLGYILLPQYAMPSAVIMRIAFLFIGAQAAGILVTFIRLPDMLGMLFFGVFYANVGLADFEGYAKFEGFLREMALINIMLLAGLGLDAKAFKKLWCMIMRLTLVPTIAEVIVIAVLAYLLLNMPWLWGILLGLVITAVSPNVVVTVMLKLKEDRLGLNDGIHTLIYAMTTCNDVVAIFVFGVINGVIFATGGSLTEQILQGPIGIGIGIVYGYVYGLMLQFVPSRNSTYANGLRFVLTILGGAISVMGSRAIKYPSAGALGCVTVAFIAGMGWKNQQKKLTPSQQLTYESSSVPKRLDLLWKFLKPVSFALIGKEINFAVLDGKVVGYGALLVLLGSLFRLAFAYLSTYGGNLTRKERGYITISGFPKATVQAALGPIALDMARELNADADVVSLARNILIISVLAIIFTAPLGAILMLRLAPKWLRHSPPGQSPAEEADDGCDGYNGYSSQGGQGGQGGGGVAGGDDSRRVVPI